MTDFFSGSGTSAKASDILLFTEESRILLPNMVFCDWCVTDIAALLGGVINVRDGPTNALMLGIPAAHSSREAIARREYILPN